jgi:hypothetical protein
MAAMVYLLSAATCFLCSVLLLRGYKRTSVRLLFWSGACFFGMFCEHITLYLDQIVFPDVPLLLVRRLFGLASLTILLYGLVWDTK